MNSGRPPASRLRLLLSRAGRAGIPHRKAWTFSPIEGAYQTVLQWQQGNGGLDGSGSPTVQFRGKPSRVYQESEPFRGLKPPMPHPLASSAHLCSSQGTSG